MCLISCLKNSAYKWELSFLLILSNSSKKKQLSLQPRTQVQIPWPPFGAHFPYVGVSYPCDPPSIHPGILGGRKPTDAVTHLSFFAFSPLAFPLPSVSHSFRTALWESIQWSGEYQTLMAKNGLTLQGCIYPNGKSSMSRSSQIPEAFFPR